MYLLFCDQKNFYIGITDNVRVSDQYRELDIEEDILAHFGARDISVEDFLAQNKYAPFCKITTTRKKYKKDSFVIDLDVMDFGYTLAEIELMIDDESKIQEATKSIIKFAKEHGVAPNAEIPIRGKVVEFLRTKNPAHFQALIDAKVIK